MWQTWGEVWACRDLAAFQSYRSLILPLTQAAGETAPKVVCFINKVNDIMDVWTQELWLNVDLCQRNVIILCTLINLYRFLMKLNNDLLDAPSVSHWEKIHKSNDSCHSQQCLTPFFRLASQTMWSAGRKCAIGMLILHVFPVQQTGLLSLSPFHYVTPRSVRLWQETSVGPSRHVIYARASCCIPCHWGVRWPQIVEAIGSKTQLRSCLPTATLYVCEPCRETRWPF